MSNHFTRISLPEAAELLDCDPQFLRIALQQGRFSSFGVAVKMKRWTYYINKERLYKYMRGEISDEKIKESINS